MPSRNKTEEHKPAGNNGGTKKQNVSDEKTNDPDQLGKLADKERTRKPGSQSNSSDRHNNGRGGGK
jgi:hypothetical protein